MTPEKWRDIHEARIFSWETEIHDSDLYHKREKLVLNGIPEKVENAENAYMAFGVSIKNLFI